MTNPEASVIDAIDALIDEQMTGGEIAAERRAEVTASEVDRCKLCNGAWHGSPWTGVDYDHLGEYDRHSHGRAMRCPGAFATGPQRIRYRRERMRTALPDWLYGNLGGPVRRLVNGDPLSRYLRQIQAMNDLVQVLAEDDPALQQWRREQLAAWHSGPIPNLPPVMQFPRQFVHPNRLMSIPDGFQEVGFIGEGDGVTLTPRGYEADYAVIDELHIWGGDRLRYTAEVGNPVLPKTYMIPSRHGRESVTRRDTGRALLCYWGAPQVQGLWWELDPAELPWAELEITHEQDRPRDFRTGRESLPPLQRVLIELTAANGLRANPVGLIAVGHGNPAASGTVRRAYLKSLGDNPPQLYGDGRRVSTRQPTSWRRCAPAGVHPAHLVDAIREAEHL
ncbi:hypothetical protein [Mycobacteroides chelonae]|uniref:hypothetical protein n=1 Tax=Mycobacteroides chelonae TaxID=1774 RepID=UPI0009924A3C|nr:hypothetical protein [Mycobacteroides chelonae]